MSQGHVFVISEWLPRKNCDQELWKQLKDIMALTAKETDGLRSVLRKIQKLNQQEIPETIPSSRVAYQNKEV